MKCEFIESVQNGKLKKCSYLENRIFSEKRNTFNPNNLKVKKSVILPSPIFSVKYSYFRPNILCACEENGFITIIDTGCEKKRPNEEFNNTLYFHEISPLYKYQAHYNSIFDFEWCSQDNKILTASGDMSSLLMNYETGSNVFNELLLIGHSKSVKNVKQAFYDDKIFASCGRDGIIFIWDIRTNNKNLCNKNCEIFDIPHIHPVGGFKSIQRGNQQIKKKTSGLLADDSNTFTGINFYTKELLVSIETNEDDIKFWDMRKMLTDELGYFMNIPDKPNHKLTKKQISRIEEKENYIANCNQYSHIYMRYIELQESNKLSSKHNTSKNLLFGNLPSNLLQNQNKTIKISDYINKNRTDFTEFKNQTLDIFPGMNVTKLKFVEKEVLFDEECQNNLNIAKDHYKEEDELKNKIKEISKKKIVRGLTSIFISRENRKILVNSMSNTQYLYDSLYWDKYPPLELKGHKSSFYIRSVLNPNADFALSGSSDANIYIWDVKNKKGTQPIKLNGFHSMEVGAVDWGRSNDNFIASACDNGIILIWDDKQ